MFSPDRYVGAAATFGSARDGGRPFVALKTAFRDHSHGRTPRTPLQQAARFRFSEPATPSVVKERGLKPSDLHDPHKKAFLTQLTGRIFHLAASGDSESGDRKISLERLFTPATDSDDITPKRTVSRKIFASSAFYRPDHPTIEDQVELAQRISVSLIDDNNKMSKGQSMYLKRKNRATRWVHEGGAEGDFIAADGVDGGDTQRPGDKPAMKMVMNPRGVQDYQAVQEHYEQLMNAPVSPESSKVVHSPLATLSPSGKGAELFAKRKKRMDKFIVDETTVQKATHQTTATHETMTSSSVSSSSQSQVSMMGGASAATAAPHGGGAIYTAEVKVVQRNTLTPTFDGPTHSLLDLVPKECSKSEKRNSLSFNLAAKGFGTYNDFYRPITIT